LRVHRKCDGRVLALAVICAGKPAISPFPAQENILIQK
jgi:hypothetical protein